MERKVVRAVAYMLSCALIFVFGMTVVTQGYRLVRRRITVSATAGKVAENVYPTAPVWVIDPGHGGEDGGSERSGGGKNAEPCRSQTDSGDCRIVWTRLPSDA